MPTSQLIAPTVASPTELEAGLARNGDYRFRLRATNTPNVHCAPDPVPDGRVDADDADWGAWSAVAVLDAAPGPPSTLTATAGERIPGLDATTIRLSWPAPTTGGPVESYLVLHRVLNDCGRDCEYIGPETVTHPTRTFDVTGLDAGTEHDFRLHTVGTNGRTSLQARTALIIGQPAAPDGVTATPSTTSTDVEVGWNAVTARTGVTSYTVQRGPSADGPWTHGATADGDTTSADVHGLAAATTYHFRVRAKTLQRDSPWSDGSASATTEAVRARIFATVPSPLTERTLDGARLTVDLVGAEYVSALQSSQFELQPATGGLSIASVSRESNTRAVLTLDFSGDIASDLGLQVEVRTEALQANAALVTDAATVTRAPTPAQVGGVTATGGPGSVAVSWQAVGHADGYVVQWRRTADADYGAGDRLEVTGGSANRATVGKLSEETAYTVRVYATSDFAPDGPASDEETVTTLAGTNTPATGAPSISGTAQVGQVLAAGAGTIADADGLPAVSTFEWQWVRVESGGTEADISGATSATDTYLVGDADLGRTLKVRASFTDNAGNAESRTSAATAVVTEATPRPRRHHRLHLRLRRPQATPWPPERRSLRAPRRWARR